LRIPRRLNGHSGEERAGFYAREASLTSWEREARTTGKEKITLCEKKRSLLTKGRRSKNENPEIEDYGKENIPILEKRLLEVLGPAGIS